MYDVQIVSWDKTSKVGVLHTINGGIYQNRYRCKDTYNKLMVLVSNLSKYKINDKIL